MLEKIENGIDDVIGRYTYNADGIRYSKTAGGETTKFYYNGTTLVGEDRSDKKKLRYCYDQGGVCGFRYYNGSEWNSYTYVKNLQGDIILIKNIIGVPLVKYTYDPWGNITYNVLFGDNEELAKINPFRYRGYYYDEESKLYYLITRYYDPWVGQFISPDSFEYLDPGTIGGINLYAYCNYNPIMYVDPTGCYRLSNSQTLDLISSLFEFGIGSSFALYSWIILHAAKPNNLGIGLWNSFKASKIKNLSKASDILSKISTGIAVISTTISVIDEIINDINRGYSFERTLSNAFVNTAIYGGLTFGIGAVGGKIGALIGSAIPGLGNVIGASIGYGLGLLVGFLLDLQVGDKSIIEHIRDGIFSLWEVLFGRK